MRVRGSACAKVMNNQIDIKDMKRILASISMALMLMMNVGAATAQTSQSKPMDNYGFLNAPDGSTWTYTA